MPSSTCTFPAVEALEHQLEAIEAVMFSTDGARENIRRLYQLKQQVEKLRHSVVPLNDAIGKLFSGARVPAVVAHSSKYFRDVHDHLQSITRRDRRVARHDRHRDPCEPGDGDHRAERGLEAAHRLGGDLRRGDGAGGDLGHELPPHAGARLDLRLSAGRRGDGGVAAGLYRRFRKAGWI